MRTGIRAGNSELVDGTIHDGLWDSYSNSHMGNLAEYTAKKAGISRLDQDRFALASHQKAVAAMEACRFKSEILPVEVQRKTSPCVVDHSNTPPHVTPTHPLPAPNHSIP